MAGLQSRHTNMLVPSSLRKVPEARGLCKPHLMQLMVLPAKPVVPNGEPPFLDLYRRPSCVILVVSSVAMSLKDSLVLIYQCTHQSTLRGGPQGVCKPYFKRLSSGWSGVNFVPYCWAFQRMPRSVIYRSWVGASAASKGFFARRRFLVGSGDSTAENAVPNRWGTAIQTIFAPQA